MARSNRSFEQLIADWEPQLQRSFLDSIYNLRDTAQVDQIARMLENGDVNGALRAVGLDPVSFRPFDRTFEQAFDAGGIHTADILPVVRAADGLRTVFKFNVRNPAAEAWLRGYSSELVTAVLDDQRQMIRNVLTEGMSEGLNPRTIALDLVGRIGASGNREGGLIGLTDSQAQWVQAYEQELSSDNPLAALERTLRDARFDGSVRAAARSGRPIAADLINKMVTAYKNRALRYRAETIARKEAITALHTAQEQAMQQALAKGVIQQDAVTYIWRTAHDSRVRDTHLPMDGQLRPMGQPFVTGAGVHLRYPGDPMGPPEEVINCRCFREPKVDFLRGIK